MCLESQCREDGEGWVPGSSYDLHVGAEKTRQETSCVFIVIIKFGTKKQGQRAQASMGLASHPYDTCLLFIEVLLCAVIYSYNTCLLRSYCVPTTGFGDVNENESKITSALWIQILTCHFLDPGHFLLWAVQFFLQGLLAPGRMKFQNQHLNKNCKKDCRKSCLDSSVKECVSIA